MRNKWLLAYEAAAILGTTVALLLAVRHHITSGTLVFITTMVVLVHGLWRAS